MCSTLIDDKSMTRVLTTGVTKVSVPLCRSRRRARGAARQSGTDALGLDTAESLQLLRLHRYLLPKPDLAHGTLDERHTIGVHGLVYRGGAGLGASNRDTFHSGLSNLLQTTVTEELDDSALHGELDPI